METAGKESRRPVNRTTTIITAITITTTTITASRVRETIALEGKLLHVEEGEVIN